MKHKDLNHPW